MRNARNVLFSVLFIAVLVSAGMWTARDGSVGAQGSDDLPGVVVFASDRGTDNYEIYTLDPATGLTTQLTNDPGQDIEPVWSPDGEVIAFASNRDGDYELYVMQADGSDVRQLTANNAEDRLPRWQPDGAFIVYSSNVNGNWDLFVISADGANVRQLTNDEFDERGPGFVTTPLATPTPIATATPQVADAVVVSARLNVRENPGTGAAILISVEQNTQLDIIARRADNTWVQVRTPTGITGWVSADPSLLQVNIDLSTIPIVNAPLILPPPTATPTIAPTATPGVVPVIIEFTADRTTIAPGQCVTLSWRVEGIREVYFQNQGVTGTGSSQQCPTTTTTYNLRVILVSGIVDNRYITITVQ